MATTRIMPLHIGKGRTESTAISDIIDYVANPQKTDNGRLVTGYECDSRIADTEFVMAKRQYRENVQTFFVGGALGVDMWAGEQLLALKEKSGYENIEIIVAIPFVGHDSKWPEQSQKRLKSLIQKATNCIVVSQEANTASYKKRNYYMVDHADFLVGVFDNAKQMRSGTAQTVNYALRQGKQIILIHPDTADTAYLR